jgi:hypothetical protein
METSKWFGLSISKGRFPASKFDRLCFYEQAVDQKEITRVIFKLEQEVPFSKICTVVDDISLSMPNIVFMLTKKSQKVTAFSHEDKVYNGVFRIILEEKQASIDGKTSTYEVWPGDTVSKSDEKSRTKLPSPGTCTVI